MTNKLVVIINSLKVPKIKKILLYDMKFLVNYSCLQNPWIGGYRPQISVLSCPQLNLLNPPPEQNSWIRHCLKYNKRFRYTQSRTVLNSGKRTKLAAEPAFGVRPGRRNGEARRNFVNCYLHETAVWRNKPTSIICGCHTYLAHTVDTGFV